MPSYPTLKARFCPPTRFRRFGPIVGHRVAASGRKLGELSLGDGVAAQPVGVGEVTVALVAGVAIQNRRLFPLPHDEGARRDVAQLEGIDIQHVGAGIA